MVMSAKENALPQTLTKKEEGASKSPVRTRATTKVGAGKRTFEVKEVADKPTQSGRVRKNKATKGVSAMAKKKNNPLSSVVVDAIFGKLQNPVPAVEELRRKMEEDARKCGRVVKSIGKATNYNLSSKKTANVLHEEGISKGIIRNRSLECQDSDLEEPSKLNYLAEKVALRECTEETNGRLITPIVDCVDKDPRAKNYEWQFWTLKGPEDKTLRTMLDNEIPIEKDVEAFNAYKKSIEDQRRFMRILSPSQHFLDSSEKKGREKMVSPRRRCRSEPDCYDNYRSWSPTIEQKSRSRRSHSWSPRQYGKGSDMRNSKNYEENYRILTVHDKKHATVHKERIEDVRVRVDCRRRDSTPTLNRFNNQRSMSPSRRRRERIHTPSPSKFRSPNKSFPPCTHDVDHATSDRGVLAVKEDHVAIPSVAMDRRTRRYKQAVRESEKSERKGEGKKPFYLTVDNQGRPYGSGRTPWIAKINKLSTWLDPSCTYIRKQSHEDMCTFKRLLNEKFEYSGDLNEDHLRALLGKAVTRKRTELIELVKKDGDQLVYVDEDIWKRLEKLAASKQRADKTKHGRYANACRKTVGRIGSLGVEGIRERLRELYGRSPNPDEVRDEMERDKGFGRVFNVAATISKKRGNKFIEVVSKEESMQTLSPISVYEEYSSERDQYSRRKLVSTGPIQTDEVEEETERNNSAIILSETSNRTELQNGGQLQAKKVSKDDYIARLEAELESLKGGIANRTLSQRVVQSKRTVHSGDENYGLPGVFAGETSMSKQIVQGKVHRRGSEMQIQTNYIDG